MPSKVEAFPASSVLISFPICPFVGRARIVVLEKNIKLEVQLIDLENKPAWFLERSPTGTVPALDTGKHFIFESSVISEFLDEVSEGSLHPEAAADRAVNRAWTEYAAKMLVAQFMMLMSATQADFETHKSTLIAGLQNVEKAHSNQPFFNGKDFALIDAAYSPLLVRTKYLREKHGIDLLSDLPQLRAWEEALNDRASVREVHGVEYFEHLEQVMTDRASMLLQ
ncbi:glutathione S-transferase family protein [Epibacterium sp. SM1979]|uniref:Glutathione S-transferase family protein n=1 Tax=Tritonibacter litoralis TaxID=2662264 RepID=A0A843YN46_9RHOB|nr:glutathione S-transferase family protein [Tritonibacter litoralis]